MRIGIALLAIDASVARGQEDLGDAFLTGQKGLAANLAANVEDIIRLRVQQTISALPPAAPQSLSFEYDPAVDAFVRSTRVPPSVLLTPVATPTGRFYVRLAASYFELRPLLKKTSYIGTLQFGGIPELENQVFKYGIKAHVKAALLTVALSYGLLDKLELDLTVPIAIVDATASTLLSRCHEPADCPNPELGLNLLFAPSTKQLDNDLLPGGRGVLAETSFKSLGLTSLDGSPEAGLGRIGVSLKREMVTMRRLRLALGMTLEVPSPSEGELSGVGSPAWTPRLVAAVPIVEPVTGYATTGYNVDFVEAERSYFGWTVGASYSAALASADFGISGAKYAQSTELFADRHSFSTEVSGSPVTIHLQSLDNERLATNFVDLVFGLKVPVHESIWLAAIATVPVVNVEFRPEAIGTFSVEGTF